MNSFDTAKPGIDHPRADDRIPEPVPGLEGVQRFVPSPVGMFTLALDGTVMGIGGRFLLDITNHILPSVPTALSTECELRDHRVYWGGANYAGQRGIGHVGYVDGDTPYMPVLGIDDAVAIASGGTARCALRETAEVWCWGGNIILSRQDSGEELPPFVMHGPDVVLAGLALHFTGGQILLGAGDRLPNVDGATEDGLVAAGEHLGHRLFGGRDHQRSWPASESMSFRTACSNRGTVFPSPINRSSRVTGGRFSAAAWRRSSSTTSWL